MRKSMGVKIGIVVLLLLILISYNSYVKWEKTHFTVDSDAFNVKDSFAEVMDEEYEAVDGLQLADQFNKVKSLDITEEFPNEQRQLKVDKAWFLPGRFFVLYSVNLQKKDQSPEDIPELTFSEVTMQTIDGDTETFPVKERDDFRENVDYEGIVHDRRLYRGIVFDLDYDDLDDADLKYLEHFFVDTGTMTLEHPILTEHGDKDNDTKNYIENLQVTDRFSEEDYTLATFPLDEKVGLGSGESIEFSQLELTMFENRLYLNSEMSDSSIQNLGVAFTWNGEDFNQDIYSGNVYEDEGDHYISFSEFEEEVPEQVDMNLKSISYMNDENIEFNIPADFNSPEPPQEVGEVEGITFYFEGYEEEKEMQEGMIGLNLSWESSGSKVIPTDSYNNMFMNHDLEKQLDSMEYDEEIEMIKNSAMNILSVNNEKGESPEYIDPYENPDHANSVTNGDAITIFLKKSFVEQAEEIHIDMENVTYEEKIKEENFQLNIPDEYVTEGKKQTEQ